MNTCDTCKWWGVQSEIIGPWDYKSGADCRHPVFEEIGRYGPCPSSGLMDADADNYLCLITGPKFGCIHHEPKSTEPDKTATYLAIAKVSIDPKFRSSGRPCDGIRRGWLSSFDDGSYYFVDDSGWSWNSTECTCEILKRSETPAPERTIPYTPTQWNEVAKKIGFNPNL